MATDESDESSFDQGDDDESNDSSFDHRDGDLRSGFLDSETGSRSPSPFPLRKGDRVPHTAFRLEDELGSGGFGVVWRAQNDDSHELYTLKFCWPRHRDTLNVLRREGKLAFDIQRRLKDAAKRFVPIHDLFLEEDREYPFIAYQYLRGESLDKVLKRQGKRYSPFEAATIIYDLAAIISGIHELEPSVVHRDLKPANILVLNDHSWDFRVMDLGLARVVATATQAKQCGVTGAHQNERGGTCEYMSHEQYQHYETGDPSYEGDPSDDVHALGVIWYVLLAGRYFPWNCPPSHLGEPVVWSLLHKDLISWGLSKEQAEFLESCLQTALSERS